MIAVFHKLKRPPLRSRENLWSVSVFDKINLMRMQFLLIALLPMTLALPPIPELEAVTHVLPASSDRPMIFFTSAKRIKKWLASDPHITADELWHIAHEHPREAQMIYDAAYQLSSVNQMDLRRLLSLPLPDQIHSRITLKFLDSHPHLTDWAIEYFPKMFEFDDLHHVLQRARHISQKSFDAILKKSYDRSEVSQRWDVVIEGVDKVSEPSRATLNTLFLEQSWARVHLEDKMAEKAELAFQIMQQRMKAQGLLEKGDYRAELPRFASGLRVFLAQKTPKEALDMLESYSLHSTDRLSADQMQMYLKAYPSDQRLLEILTHFPFERIQGKRSSLFTIKALESQLFQGKLTLQQKILRGLYQHLERVMKIVLASESRPNPTRLSVE